jgi:hypothetical protein
MYYLMVLPPSKNHSNSEEGLNYFIVVFSQVWFSSSHIVLAGRNVSSQSLKASRLLCLVNLTLCTLNVYAWFRLYGSKLAKMRVECFLLDQSVKSK